MGHFVPLAAAAAVIVLGMGVASRHAWADEEMLKSSMIACPSDKTVMGGVHACGKIWALHDGEAELAQNGHVRVELHGLVLNDPTTAKYNGSPDGVDAVAVTVVCGGTNGSVAAQAEPVTLSQKGDATIDVKLTMPAHCFAPVVLVRERYQGKIGGWLAATGF